MIKRLTVLEFNNLAVPLVNSVIGKVAGYEVAYLDGGQDDLTNYWGYYKKDELAGIIGIEPTLYKIDRYDLDYFAVGSEYQRKGIGKSLLTFIENEVRKRRANSLRVETYLNDNFSAARNFYEKNGFVKTGEIKDYLRDGSPAIYYTKYL